MNLSRTSILAGVAVLALLAWIGRGCSSQDDGSGGVHTVTRGRLEAWTAYDGSIQSRTVRGISSQLGGTATIVELVPEGSHVTNGTPLVRLDASSYERDLIRVERELALARAEQESLINARIPLERSEMEIRLLQANADLDDAESALADLRELIADGLIPEQDAVQQEKKNTSLRATRDNIQRQLELTRDHLHPAMLDRAGAQLEAAGREADLARRQMEQSVIAALTDGVVVYQPLNLSGEFRTVRVGDTVFKNQVFITLSDMSDLIVRVDVPEYELTLAQQGRPAFVQPLAYPGLRLRGVIESVGSMAQARPDRPGGQKFFQVVVRLDETSPELRTGMSARVQVLSHEADAVLLIPRAAVNWDNGEPSCLVLDGSRRVRKPLKLGPASAQEYAVLDGVEEGQRIVVP